MILSSQKNQHLCGNQVLRLPYLELPRWAWQCILVSLNKNERSGRGGKEERKSLTFLISHRWDSVLSPFTGLKMSKWRITCSWVFRRIFFLNYTTAGPEQKVRVHSIAHQIVDDPKWMKGHFWAPKLHVNRMNVLLTMCGNKSKDRVSGHHPLVFGSINQCVPNNNLQKSM